MNYFTFFLLLFLGFSLEGAAVDHEGLVLWRSSTSPGFADYVVTGADVARPDQLAEWVNKKRSLAAPVPHIEIVEGFRTVSDAYAGAGNTPIHVSYDWWLNKAERIYKKPPPAVRFTRIGKRVVLESFNNFVYKQSTISGLNPIQWSGEGRVLRILQIRDRQNELDHLEEFTYNVYVKSDPMVSSVEAVDVTLSLQKLLNHKDIEVVLRPDVWFVGHWDAPIWFPFAEDKQLPTEAQLSSVRAVMCSANKNQIDCATTGLLDHSLRKLRN